MEKEIKKLESRQDILEGVRLEKGAWFNGGKVAKIKQMPFALMLEFEEPNGVFKYRETNIYEILYSPESNFFEVMFPGKILVRVTCVVSKDPLLYLIDNLNETTS